MSNPEEIGVRGFDAVARMMKRNRDAPGRGLSVLSRACGFRKLLRLSEVAFQYAQFHLYAFGLVALRVCFLASIKRVYEFGQKRSGIEKALKHYVPIGARKL